MGLRDELKNDTERIISPVTKQLPANTKNKRIEAKKDKKLSELKKHTEIALDGSKSKPDYIVRQERKAERKQHIVSPGVFNPSLQDISKLPPEEAFALRSKGGKVASQNRREKESLKKCMQLLLDMPVNDRKTIKMLTEMGFDAKKLTYRMLVTIGVLRSAAQGNVSALHEIRDLIGEIDKVSGEDLDLNVTITRAKKESVSESDESEADNEEIILGKENKNTYVQ